MKQALQLLAKTRIVPVIQIDNVENAIPLAKTLVDNGLPIAEVTLRSSCRIRSDTTYQRAFSRNAIDCGYCDYPTSGRSSDRGRVQA